MKKHEIPVGNKEADISLLSDELWVNIFTFFNSITDINAARLCCRRFFNIANDKIVLDQFPGAEYDYSVKNTPLQLQEGNENLVVAVSPLNSFIAVYDGVLRKIELWNTNGNSISKLPMPGGFRSYISLAFSQDDQYLVAASTYDDVDVWSVKDNKLLHTISPDTRGKVQHKVLTLSNGNFLVLYNYHADIFSLQTGNLLKSIRLGEEFISCSISADEKLLVCCSREKITIFDMASGSEVKKLKVDFYVYHAEFTMDNENIIFCGNSKKVQIVNLNTEIVSTLVETKEKSEVPAQIHSFKVSRNGSYIVIPEYDNNLVGIWNMMSRARVNEIPCGKFVGTVLFNSSQDKLIIGSYASVLISTFPLLPLEERVKRRQVRRQADRCKNKDDWLIKSIIENFFLRYYQAI